MDLIEYNTVDNRSLRRHPWEQARLQILEFLIKKSEQAKTIVDIGSGDAYLANNIALNSPKSVVIAVDINYDETVLEKLNVAKPSNVYYFNNLQIAQSFLSTSCDAIVLMDVLEHVAHPEDLLKEISQKLPITSKTQFIITVPAFQLLFSQHDKRLGHYKRYNLKELRQLLQSEGFVIQRSGYCFSTLLIPRLAQLMIENLRSEKISSATGVHNWKGNKFLTAIIKNLLWAEFKLSWFLARMKIYLPGLTCYSICHYSPSLFHATTKDKD